MAIADLPFDEALRFRPEDDRLHPPGPTADWTETTWWSFNVPERDLAGWLYAQIRPNLGTVAGGAFVYDPSAHVPWELPYNAWFSHHRVPEPLDLMDVTFRSGVSVRCVEPGMRYELGYRFRDHETFAAALEFEGLTPPVPHVQGAPPFTGSSHYDQHGRVRGTLQLRGERIEVDCIAVRDRSWGRRPELVGRRGRLSYAFGATSPDEAFLVFCVPDGDHLGDDETSTSGYLLRDGVVGRIERVRRRVTRDPAHGGVASIELDGVDTDGRSFRADGSARSRMFLTGNSVCVNTFVRWDVAGRVGWGEDQDVWPVELFADRRRIDRDAVR